jgi:hypothetical protein
MGIETLKEKLDGQEYRGNKRTKNSTPYALFGKLNPFPNIVTVWEKYIRSNSARRFVLDSSD